ncbi:alkaline phosphatase family protein [Streptomyces sp. HPF1205]|uniref:alkaline phosphatase family protein n=1 Tax=Streptomyces sp. HPF1205 TaxID=2873262 RepID=UPI001CECB701|nr:alkaline phosphatase family protein [Streptomyces sp. HPF1205]
MAELTRRRLLGAAAGAIGGSAALTLLPPSLQRAVAAGPPRNSSLADIEHVVLLMQENRSFDHYFGTLSGVRGFGDPAALKLSTGRSVFYQPDSVNPDGYVLPFHLDTKKSSAQAIPSTSHAWSVQHQAWNNGRMDKWLPAHRAADGANGPYVMGYYTRDDIPFQFALAENFTVCDNYFCSVMGPTWPNRLYWMTGTIDPGGTKGGPVISNSAPKPYTWTTYAERLQAAGVSWKVYQQTDDYGCNLLEQFAAFKNAKPGSALYEQGVRPQPAGTFEDDARADRLPTVSWIIPTSTQSEHPDYLPAAGADFVAQKLEAIAANPDVWAKTAFILNYDENDGLFDHVPPPTAPAGTAAEYVNGLPIGAGFRVPAIIVSPWTVGGYVASEAFDHTSPLRFLEHVTGVKETNISAWRRSTFGDLTSVFRFTDTQPAPRLPTDTAQQLAEAQQEVATLPKPTLPGADQSLPVQEPGSRPHV